MNGALPSLQPVRVRARVPAPGAVLATIALALVLLAAVCPLGVAVDRAAAVAWSDGHGMAALAWLGAAALAWLWPSAGAWRCAPPLLATAAAAVALAATAPGQGTAEPAAGFWFAVLALVLLAVVTVQRLAALDRPAWAGAGTALVCGLWLLGFWQLLVTAFAVPRVLLPAPLGIAAALADAAPTLWGDFVQTVLKAALVGWALGSAVGMAVALAIDRSPFLQRGLLPLAALTSTVPLVAVAPIAVMWFGFDWPSKAAVVVLMTFFPMLVAVRAGLAAAGRQEHELMHCLGAGYGRTLLALRLPSAVPQAVSALKVNASLALIGAIVAEFFGSPTAGLGFRISTEAAKLNMALVWAAIAVAAVTGTAAHAALSVLERRLAFWHPSVRGR